MNRDAERRALFALDREIEKRTAARVFLSDAGDFALQDAFVRCDARRQVARCSRRAGKTTGIARKLLRRVRKLPHPPACYVGPTLKNARHILWPVLKRINAKYQLGGVPNESEAYMTFPALPGEPRIHLFGAKDQGEVEPMRGHSWGLAVVDEIQAVRPVVVASLIDDILEPSLLDYDGQLAVAGTPGPVMAGPFWDIDQGGQAAAYEHFFWTMRDNLHLQKLSGRPIDELLREVRDRHKWTEDNHTYRREYGGEWVQDEDALALHYDKERNGCAWQKTAVEGWSYIVCFDLGYEDADAIGILGWQANDRRVYLCDELVLPKQAITPLGNQLQGFYRTRQPHHMPGDFGGLGKKIAVELQSRWNLPVTAADKQRKAEHLMLLDDALRTGNFMAPPDSRFAQDCGMVQWDQEAKTKGLLKLSDSYHSDIVDAVLYGYRKSPAFLEPDKITKPPVGTAEAFEQQEREMRSSRMATVARRVEQPWWDQED